MKSSFEVGTDNSKHRYDPSNKLWNSFFESRLSKIPVLNSLNSSKFVTLRIFWTIGTDHMASLIVTSITRKSDRDLVTDTCNNEMMQYYCNNIMLVIRLNNQMPRNMTFIWIYHRPRWKRAVFSKWENFFQNLWLKLSVLLTLYK